MQPNPCQLAPISAATLSGFIFVVRKEQIRPATMNDELVIKQSPYHRHALAMPARSSLTKRRIIKALIKFPKHKIAFIFLCHFIF